ncbi:MAG TPA: hypothetical protein VGJ81_06350 [Thermoanaerobaculia bacterium]|jgi:hypothetical protein
MMATRNKDDDFERSAAGMDYEDPIRERAASIGASIAENGPEVIFEEIENLLPEEWREQIKTFPLAAMLLGLGVGIFLGMKKGDDIIAAGSALVTSAAMSNVNEVLGKVGSR